jgi:hypothetical protein
LASPARPRPHCWIHGVSTAASGAPGGDHGETDGRVAEDFRHAVRAEQLDQNAGGDPADLRGRRLRAVALREVSAFEAFEGSQGIGLRVAAGTPGPDRGADQEQRLAAAGDEMRGECAVETTDRQPFGAAGRAGHDAERVTIEAVLAQLPQRGRASQDSQGRSSHRPQG